MRRRTISREFWKFAGAGAGRSDSINCCRPSSREYSRATLSLSYLRSLGNKEPVSLDPRWSQGARSAKLPGFFCEWNLPPQNPHWRCSRVKVDYLWVSPNQHRIPRQIWEPAKAKLSLHIRSRWMIHGISLLACLFCTHEDLLWINWVFFQGRWSPNMVYEPGQSVSHKDELASAPTHPIVGLKNLLAGR